MANVQDVARCFLYLDAQQEDGDGISNLKLQKLVYYAQGFHLAIYDDPLFEAEIEAWTHGPVVPELYRTYREHGRNPIPYELGEFDPLADFNEAQREHIEEVYEVFGQYSAWTLRNMTHEETPWLDHERNADVIPFDEMKDYFKKRIE
ncbi:DUF4065 domain-containing protein [Marinobacterium sp. D7]|uniref:Panacea domain-containing protein n=1 Tax=Marinobacterium ramblicola TaxID=2849041 RepID=UPI001C2D5564|nr:type II toxin-antitoxin system antitoxin SocA domain-containing protein [Marinobacterium ramblicola]MBV1789033.1 DUF4065 domain-containing protein [Marinobacterium ramblicola]